jgi:hypothetical protein
MSAYRRDAVIIGLIALIVGVIMAALLHHPATLTPTIISTPGSD